MGNELSAQPLIEILEKLLKLHKSLYQIALEKTEVIKKGDIEALNLLMKNEQTHINAITMIDKEREKILSKLLPDREETTLTDCLPLFPESDKDKLASLQKKLTNQLDQLKSVNGLNQELLEQSLQYVYFNLDLFLPNDLENYSKDNDEEPPLPNLSLFDSKA